MLESEATATVMFVPVSERLPPRSVVGLFQRRVAPLSSSTETALLGRFWRAEASIRLLLPLAKKRIKPLRAEERVVSLEMSIRPPELARNSILELIAPVI